MSEIGVPAFRVVDDDGSKALEPIRLAYSVTPNGSVGSTRLTEILSFGGIRATGPDPEEPLPPGEEEPPLPPPPPPGAAIVRLPSSTTQVGDVDADDPSPSLYTISGLVVDKRVTTGARILWAHNDNGAGSSGGGDTVVFAVADTPAPNRRVRAACTLQGTFNGVGGDWESMSDGPGPDPDGYYLYVGNVGAQGGDTDLKIYRFQPPAVTAGQARSNVTIPSSAIDTFTFNRPTGTRDCEAIAVDPQTGDLLYFEKRSGLVSGTYLMGVYRIPASQLGAGSRAVTLMKIGEVVGKTPQQTNGGTITDASFTEDGSALMWHTYQGMWVVNRATPGQPLADLIRETPVYVNLSSWGTETGAFDRGPNPTRIYGGSEGVNSSIKYLSPVEWSATTEPPPPDPEEPPPPTGTRIRRLGAYNGGGFARDRHFAQFMGDRAGAEGPGLPMISSQYVQNGGNSAALRVVGFDVESAREQVRRGISPLLTITAKNTDALVRLANGEASAVAWIEEYAGLIAGIQTINPLVPVYWSFEHEYDVKTNDGTYPASNPASNPATYGQAMQRVFQIGYEVARQSQWGIWVGGSRRDFIGQFVDEIAKGSIPPKMICADPYNNEAAKESPQQCFGPILDFFRSRASVRTMQTKAAGLGWEVRYGISETGRSWYAPRVQQVRHNDASLAEFWAATPQAMEDADVDFVVGFMRTSGPNGWQKINVDTSHMGYVIGSLGEDPSLPKRFPQACAAFSGSLAELKAQARALA